MGKVIPMLGGGGGADLDVITAGAGDVLTGKVIVDKDGDPMTGTMNHLTNETSIQHAQGNGTRVVIGDEAYVSTNTDGVTRAEIRYNGGGGYIAGNTLLGVEQGKMAAAIGLTGDKLIAGSNVLGVAGDPGVKNTRDANLNPDYLVEGQSGYDDGVLKWGNMPDCGNWGANVGMNGSVAIPYGRHGGGGAVHGPSVPYQNADIAGTDRARATQRSCWDGTVCLGVRNGHYLNGVNWIQHDDPNFRAANIKKGVPIMGLIGTFEGWVPTPQDLYLRGNNIANFGYTCPSYHQLSTLYLESGQMRYVQGSGASVWDGICSNRAVDFSGYSNLNVDFTTSGSGAHITIFSCTERISAYNSNGPYQYEYCDSRIDGAYGITRLSLDISNINARRYVLITLRGKSSDNTLIISRIWIS